MITDFESSFSNPFERQMPLSMISQGRDDASIAVDPRREETITRDVFPPSGSSSRRLSSSIRRVDTSCRRLHPMVHCLPRNPPFFLVRPARPQIPAIMCTIRGEDADASEQERRL